MMIIGVDYHPSFQQIAFLIEETGECEAAIPLRFARAGGLASEMGNYIRSEGMSNDDIDTSSLRWMP